MAVYNGLDTVPLGQAGTGAAFILPQGSTAADRLLDTIDYNQKVGQQNALNKQKAAQQLAQSYQDNAFKAKNGTLFNNELMALQQKHIQQGQDYAKQGFDIYNPNPSNPAQMSAHDQYMADRAKLYNMQDVRDQLQKHLVEQDAALSKAKPGTYDANSIADLHDFFNKNTLQDIITNGKQAPYVREAFDPETTVGSKLTPIMSPETEYVKNGHKVTSKQFMPKETASAIGSQFTSVPGGEDYVQKQTGITPTQAKLLPDSLDAITKLNDGVFRTPQGQQALVQQGITSYDDPKYQQLLQQKSQQDFAKKQQYNGFIQQYVDRARAKAQIVNKDIPDFTYENQAIKRRQDARAQKEFDDKQDDRISQVAYNVPASVPLNPSTKDSVVPNKGTVTSPLEIDAGDLKGLVVPDKVYNTETGHYGTNTDARDIKSAKVRLMPTWQGGQLLTDDQVQQAKDGKLKLNGKKVPYNDINYTYMVYGIEKKKKAVVDDKGEPAVDANSVPKTTTVEVPVAFPANSITNDKFNKKVDYDKYEKSLPIDIQLKILKDRIKSRYPDLTDDELNSSVSDLYNTRKKSD